jgi:hypothetical protein
MSTKTHHQMALVIAEPHKNEPVLAVSREWTSFLLNTSQNLPPDEKIERIAANCWLIPLDSGLHYFSALIQLLKRFEVPVRVLFLDDAPSWSRHPPSA